MPRIDYSSLFKPIWLPAVTIVTTTHYLTHDVFVSPALLIPPFNYCFPYNGKSSEFFTGPIAFILLYYIRLRNAFRERTLQARGAYCCSGVHRRFGFVGQEEHVTNSQDAYRMFPLKKTIVSTSELSFSVRAVISASVTYYTAPARQTPRLIVSYYLF